MRIEAVLITRPFTRGAFAACACWFALSACNSNRNGSPRAALAVPAKATPPTAPARTRSPLYQDHPLGNRFAYIPPQCYTATRDDAGHSVNPCYVCHTKGEPPNYVDDSDLQVTLKFPAGAADNPWSNSFAPAATRQPAVSDPELLAYVGASNYFAADGGIVLARTLAALPDAWDGQGDQRWDGFVPDAYFHFDAHGYDLRPDGSDSGWRAIAYRPLPGAFFPTNGSIGDVLMRLDAPLRQRADGRFDRAISELNFAIVEALIARHDIAIAPTDEVALNSDLDLDGQLGTAHQITFRDHGMHYVGKAASAKLEPGLYPLNTEFLHSLRYLDVQHGRVTMAPRMKELRYAKKARWLSPAELHAHADAEAVELAESATGALEPRWQFDRGVYNGQGWLLQAFIEDREGALRPQTYEESLFCVGCHGGIGVTTDSMFAFARKLTSPAGGYAHWTQHDLTGVQDAPAGDGDSEYVRYLTLNRAGDEFRDNAELSVRFFDVAGELQSARRQQLRRDVSTLLLPSPARALALDRAYRAVVLEQSFAKGRDAVLAGSHHVHTRVEPNTPTGLTPVTLDAPAPLARAR